MHLRAIKLRGFKSFPDPVEVRLEPGVAVVVGPNGSGKSNVADGIVWAAGSLAPSELRAEKPDDVLFAGGGGRTPEDFCEVELLFDNPDGAGRRTAAQLARKHADSRLDSLLEERRRVEEELADAAGRREEATATLYRLRSARERLELRRESATALLENLRAELSRPRRVLDARVRAEREALRDQARLAAERLQALERALAEREGLPPAARALAEEGERLALSLLEPQPGRERAIAAALRHRASALVADDARAALALAERARVAGLGSVVVLTGDPRELVRELPVVPKEQLLSSQVPAVTPEGFGYDPQSGELWFAGETAEAVWLELDARRRALATEVEELEAHASAPIPADAYTAARDPVTVALARLAARRRGGCRAVERRRRRACPNRGRG